MATATKTAPHLAALARADELDQQEKAARANRDKTRARIADLQNRNHSGDHAVTGFDLMTARADVEAAEGLAAHAARMLADARTEAADLLADHTATQVLANLKSYDLATTQQDAAAAIASTLAGFIESLTRRHADSDATGQALADAGIPPGQWVNGIRYVPVRTLGGTGTAVPGRFNVELETDDGAIVWLSSTGSARETNRENDRMIHDVLSEALRPGGRKLVARAFTVLAG